MIDKTTWILRVLARRMWVRAVAVAVLGLAAALAGVVLGPYIPDPLARRFGAEAVDQILGILASSMLAVTTFSLAIAVQAYSAAATTATPRASRLLQEDRTTQNVLATFVGAFLFSLIGIIAVNAGVYNEHGRVVLFAASIIVVALVVVALLRWISHLMTFGRIEDTLERVERTAASALEARSKDPFLGGKPWAAGLPEGLSRVCPESVGYIQHIDVQALDDCARQAGGEIWLADLPGGYVHPEYALLHLGGTEPSDELADKLRAAFTIGSTRSFDQDPRFGLIVLSEIASRALSPAVNDPGTAIDVTGRLLRVLSNWHPDPEPDVRHQRLHIPSLQPLDLLEDAYGPIARDGAGMIEVQIRLQKALAALAASQPAHFADPVRHIAGIARERADAAFTVEADRQRLAAVLRGLQGGDATVPRHFSPVAGQD
jgi:uncharacterized membrane protein